MSAKKGSEIGNLVALSLRRVSVWAGRRERKAVAAAEVV